MACKEIIDPHVLPGWGCCKCRGYNGPQREQCRNCGHPVCGNVDRAKLKAMAERMAGRKLYPDAGS